MPEAGKRLERVKGIEPSYAAWEAAVLPLNYTRMPDRHRLMRAGSIAKLRPAGNLPVARLACGQAAAALYRLIFGDQCLQCRLDFRFCRAALLT